MSPFSLREYHIVRVLEGTPRRWCRKCHVNRSGSNTSSKCRKDNRGEALFFSLKQVLAKDWGACVPSRPQALTGSQSQTHGGIPQGIQGRKANRSTARGIAQEETSPTRDIAQEENIAQERHRASTVQNSNKERWLQGHKFMM